MLTRTGSIVTTFFALVIVLGAGEAAAQTYPAKPIRIVTSDAGSGADFGARIIAQEISGPLGQPVIVENRPGGLIAETVAKAPPDGYTLAFGASAIWVTPLFQKTSYDAVADFSPTTMVAIFPNLLVVHPSVPVKSVKELVALAKARPGELNYAAGPTGGGTHLAGALFKAMTGVDMLLVPYKGAAPALNATIAGESHVTINNVIPTIPHVKSGRLRALAVTSARPSALAPELPTVAAAGLPGYESVALVGILAPAKTPAAIINRLNQELVRVLTRDDVKEKFLNVGSEVITSSPEQFATAIRADIAKWSKVIKDAGIKVE